MEGSTAAALLFVLFCSGAPDCKPEVPKDFNYQKRLEVVSMRLETATNPHIVKLLKKEQNRIITNIVPKVPKQKRKEYSYGKGR